MINLDFKLIKLSNPATRHCQIFKTKTGLTPNIACRLGLAVSLADENPPSIELYASDDEGQVINRYTFLGEHELVLMSLFIMWCEEKKIPENDYYKHFIAHINRGVEMLVNRVKSLDELINLI